MSNSTSKIQAFDDLLLWGVIKVQLEGWISLFEEYLKDDQIALSRVQGIGYHLSRSDGACEALGRLDLDTTAIEKIFESLDSFDTDESFQDIVRLRMEVMLKAFKHGLIDANKFVQRSKKFILEGVEPNG